MEKVLTFTQLPGIFLLPNLVWRTGRYVLGYVSQPHVVPVTRVGVLPAWNFVVVSTPPQEAWAIKVLREFHREAWEIHFPQ